MYSPTRRNERRRDVIDELGKSYRISALVDYSSYEQRGLHLEGTGSLVLDYVNRIAYVSLSKRSDRALVERFCQDFDFEPLLFESTSDDGRPIYHTNVVMCVGSEFALIGLDMIADQGAAGNSSPSTRSKRKESDRRWIALKSQISPGTRSNCATTPGSLLVLSSRAAAALTAEQRSEIERHARLLAPGSSHDRNGRRQRPLYVGSDSFAAALDLDRRRLQTLKIGRHTSPNVSQASPFNEISGFPGCHFVCR